jgi:hypothetical protein
VTQDEDHIDGPAVVEMMGHRQVAGHVRSVRVAGAGLLRITTPTGGPVGSELVQYVSPASVYALHLVGERDMLAAVARLAGSYSPVAQLTADPWSGMPDVVDAHVCDDDECDDHEDDEGEDDDRMPYVSGDLADS